MLENKETYTAVVSTVSEDDIYPTEAKGNSTFFSNVIKHHGSRLFQSFRKQVGLFSDDEEEIVNLVQMMFNFFSDPNSSKVAYYWAALTCFLVLARVLEIGLESCNGPNQYYGRDVNNAQYKFLLTAAHYWDVYVALMVPLIIDALGRVVMLCFIAFGEENKPLLRKILDDKLETVLFAADIFSVIPFFVRLFYYHPSMQHEDGAALVFLTIIELLITGRILRLIKDIPSVRAIRIALSKSASHLVLPLFFFFVFNITAGVLFYFIEPCFNSNSCFWLDLFSATFYSIVTMTTSKNNSNKTEPDRNSNCYPSYPNLYN